MKRKLALIMLAVLIILTVVACGNSSEPQGQSQLSEDSGSVENSQPTEITGETDWPTHPVNVILHASAGGDTDFNARTFAEYFEQITGQPLIVTNMPGASGVAATESVRQASPDGYTGLFTHTGPLVVNYISGLIDYNYSLFDVSCIPAVDGGVVVVASKESGIKSMDDLIEKSKAKPGEIIFGTEFGNYSHLQVLMLQDIAGIDMKLADIGSGADKITNLLGGRIDLAAITYGSVKDYLETGDMVALGQFNEERNEYLGNIPTMKEQGIDMVMDKPYIIAFPQGTDPAIIKKMNDIAVEISQIPEYGEKLRDGFSQEVRMYETEEAIKVLDGILDEYMNYQDDLKAAN